MIKKTLVIGTLLSTLMLGACQTNTLYHWGQYDSKLLAYYKDTDQIDAFEAELFALIEQSDTTEKRLAPGIFAEYGFIQMQKGDRESAVKFFKLEKKNWPEATMFMDTMIKVANGQRGGQEKTEKQETTHDS